jgi:F-box/WD-40 domain protein 7
MKQIKALLGRSGGDGKHAEAGQPDAAQTAAPAEPEASPSGCVGGRLVAERACSVASGSYGLPHGVCRRGTAEEKPAVPQAPSSFYCPVSMELMSDPVIVATGHTYDRSCIQKWLDQGNRTCPVTGMRLRHLELMPNHALRNAIQVSGSDAVGSSPSHAAGMRTAPLWWSMRVTAAQGSVVVGILHRHMHGGSHHGFHAHHGCRYFRDMLTQHVRLCLPLDQF